MVSPSVILTSQFTTPNAKSFTNYYSYMTRKEALLNNKKTLSNDEEIELNIINDRINHFNLKEGDTYSSLKKTDITTNKEYEADLLLNSMEVLNNSSIDFGKYIAYMSREYALSQKEKLTKEEEKELSVVRKKKSTYFKNKTIPKTSRDKIIPGIFSKDKTEMTREDVDQVNDIVSLAQSKGSIIYQDVISFDTDFLVKEKLYNPLNKELNEKRIQDASRVMMEKMFKDEQIKSGYWFASIHRNTNHIHIHYGTVESENTRQLLTFKENGVEYKVPKGKRKMKTIDNMKSTFANALVDRTAQLSRISELRNTLVKDIKEIYRNSSDGKTQKIILSEIYDELPTNKKYWQYDSQHLTTGTRKKLDTLTDSLMKDNPYYYEYSMITKDESNYRKNLFGSSERDEKDYEENKHKEIKKRLGNSILKEMKQTNLKIELSRNYKNKEKKENRKHVTEKKNQKSFVSNVNLYQLKKVLYDDYEKYRAQMDFEKVQQRIQWEQQNREI